MSAEKRDAWVSERMGMQEHDACPHGMMHCDYGGNCEGCLKDAWDAGKASCA